MNVLCAEEKHTDDMITMSKNILIIGYGNVGRAIGKIEEEAGNNVYILERDSMPEKVDYDVCHITIPNSNEYVKIVTDYLRESKSHLKEAHFVLRDLVTGIKQAGGEDELEADDEDEQEDEEVVEEEEEESDDNETEELEDEEESDDNETIDIEDDEEDNETETNSTDGNQTEE